MISRIITIDQSTSATKAMLFSESCELLHRVNIEHQQFYPQTRMGGTRCRRNL